MKPSGLIALATCLAALWTPAGADPGKGHVKRGHGHAWHGPADHHAHRGSPHKEHFRDGPCTVERKWDKKGRYKEKRDCAGSDRYAYRYVPQPMPPQVAMPRPGVYVQPPALVIQPPAIALP